MYSFTMVNQDGTKGAKKVSKGVAKYIIKSSIHHDEYKRVLLNRTQSYATMNGIRHVNHNLYTTRTEKIALSANDNKRIVCFDGVNTFALVQFNARGVLPWPGANEPQAAA